MRKRFVLMAALLAAAAVAAWGKDFAFRFYGQVRADLFYTSRANEEVYHQKAEERDALTEDMRL